MIENIVTVNVLLISANCKRMLAIKLLLLPPRVCVCARARVCVCVCVCVCVRIPLYHRMYAVDFNRIVLIFFLFFIREENNFV